MHNGEFLPGMTLPPSLHGGLRRRLAEISGAIGIGNCLIAQARVEGMVEALERLEALEPGAIERLYVLVEQTTTVRLHELERERSEGGCD
ncbi:hypothetical protein H4C81_10485 [Pseudomonas monteilii]|uniref:hypothetical protein n=1 Tax=Pseudomonas monteilii TaxID=76759 RepID=UPI0015FA0756|nr:hypothetical protein [Pseudomonas monteilii]MBA6089320.1 hypothetical protein [Pseudomonas monteilii]